MTGINEGDAISMTSPQPLYKIISAENGSTHGGAFDWTPYLPTDDGPGAWTPEITPVRVCASGYHLTSDLMQWPKVGMQVFRAEGEGAADTQEDKTAFASVRLIEPADELVPDWWRAVEAFVHELPTLPWLTPQVDSLPDEIDGVRIRLFGTYDSARASARASAYDSAYDSAYASARASAYASARASAWDSAYDSAYDSARAIARAIARASAWDSVWDSARASAWDSALYAVILVCSGLDLHPTHVTHTRARMEVWRLGYGVHCDVDGVLYCYRSLT